MNDKKRKMLLMNSFYMWCNTETCDISCKVSIGDSQGSCASHPKALIKMVNIKILS